MIESIPRTSESACKNLRPWRPTPFVPLLKPLPIFHRACRHLTIPSYDASEDQSDEIISAVTGDEVLSLTVTLAR
jgi:hypothetical protein